MELRGPAGQGPDTWVPFISILETACRHLTALSGLLGDALAAAWAARSQRAREAFATGSHTRGRGVVRGGGGGEDKTRLTFRRQNQQNEPPNWMQGRDPEASDPGAVWTVGTDPRLRASEEVRAWGGGWSALAGACWQTPEGTVGVSDWPPARRAGLGVPVRASEGVTLGSASHRGDGVNRQGTERQRGREASRGTRTHGWPGWNPTCSLGDRELPPTGRKTWRGIGTTHHTRLRKTEGPEGCRGLTITRGPSVTARTRSHVSDLGRGCRRGSQEGRARPRG